MDKQHERLVELLDYIREHPEKTCPQFNSKNMCKGCKYEQLDDCCSSRKADYLLANGVIVPPCKVGDIVYFVSRNSGKPIGTIDEIEIVMIGKTETGFCAKGKLGENTFDVIPHFEIDNYTFFASREEAEKALGGVKG